MAFKSLALAAGSAILALTLAAAPAFAWHRDRDNNPPGPRGGPGTNWENPPGWRGGPGASPDRHWPRSYLHGAWWVWVPTAACWMPDPDWNPPGWRGGPGTNWENPPGPAGGPGVSPDRNICR